MPNKKVLIIYGSRYGCTEEVAKRIAETIRQSNMDVDLVNVQDKDVVDSSLMSKYDGILIGTGIRGGKWVKKVQNVVEKNQLFLRTTKIPVGFFICSISSSFPETYEDAKNNYLIRIIHKYGIESHFYGLFGGVLDLSPTSNLSWLGKTTGAIMYRANKRIRPHIKNDFRNWDEITKFTQSFAHAI